MKDKEYYLSKGFDEATAAYFAGGRKRITHVLANDDWTLTLTFDDSEKRILDAKDFLVKGSVFEPICDLASFKRVYLDEDAAVSWDIDPLIDSRKVWSNKLDLSPDCCYLDSKPIAQ